MILHFVIPIRSEELGSLGHIEQHSWGLQQRWKLELKHQNFSSHGSLWKCSQVQQTVGLWRIFIPASSSLESLQNTSPLNPCFRTLNEWPYFLKLWALNSSCRKQKELNPLEVKFPCSQQVAAASPSHHKLSVSLKEMCGDAAKAVGAVLGGYFPI